MKGREWPQPTFLSNSQFPFLNLSINENSQYNYAD